MNAYLVLETGEIYEGRWRGGQDRAGEVVFNTSHSGYEEIATDPSYMNQIVVMTAPMMGNYGVNRIVWESRQYWIEGFIALQIQETSRDADWVTALRDRGIPIVSDLDTRNLVLRLRTGGTPWGALIQASDEKEAKAKALPLIQSKRQGEKDWVWLASRKEKEVRQGRQAHGPRLTVLDFGAKENILRELLERCCELTVLPSRSTVAQVLETKPQGLMLTNGPGDPADVQIATGTVRELLGKVPIFGICMGHQILGLALGAETYKLKFGHRGANHPIKDNLVGKIYMSSQNHGYAVKVDTLPADVKVTQTNLNDGTCAGLYSASRNCLGIQYHPESRPGPHEATELFDFFVDKMIHGKGKSK